MRNYQPGNIDIQEILLYNYKGEPTSLSDNFQTINIQEDMFSTVTTGSIIIIDSDNLIETFPIVGEETLTVVYRTDEGFDWVTRKFYVSHCSNRTRLSEGQYTYVLSFCSEELMQNKSMIVSRSFDKKSPSEVVDIVLRNIIKTDKEINIEDSLGLYSYIAPNIRPFEVISSMSNKARSKTHSNGASYLFFENKKGFNFVSLESLFDIPGFMYELGTKNSNQTLNSFNTVNAISASGSASILDSMASGGLGANTKSLDLQSKRVTDVSYNYFDDAEYSKMNHVNGTNSGRRLTTSEYKYKTNTGLYKFVVGKSNVGDNFKDVNVAKRYAQLSALSNGPKVHIEVHMNSDLTVGDIIYLKVLTATPSNLSSDKLKEEMFSSGKYIITCLRHEFGLAKGRTMLELSRDSYSEDHEFDSKKTTPVTGSGR